MKLKIYFSIFFLIFPLLSLADDSTNALSQKLANFYSFKANFDQNLYDQKGHLLQQSQGKIALQRPGLFYWYTQQPSKQILIADGKKIWFYDVSLKQASLQKQTKTPDSPALLLSGSVQDLIQRFNIKQINLTSSTLTSFELTPKENQGLFKAVQLIFNQNELTSMKLIDHLNETTEINFTQIQMNPKLNPQLFHFKPPQGIDIVHNDA